MSDGNRRKKGSRAKRPAKKKAPPETTASDSGESPQGSGTGRKSSPADEADKKAAGSEKPAGAAKKTRASEKSASKKSARPAEAPGAAKAKRAKDESASDESKPGAGEQDPADASSEPAPKKKEKITLPAFGMAEDLLRELRERGEAQEGSRQGATPDEEKTARQGSDVEDAAASLSPADPERIFDFADRLQGGYSRSQEEGEQVELEAFVTFALADETFALPVEPIREVMRISAITRVPHAPRPIRGVTNLRGRVIPVIDLRQRIGLAPGEIEKTHRIIVVAARKRLIGLLVDAVEQVVHLDLAKVQPPPEDVMTVQSDYISGIYQLERELVLLLDVERSLVIKEPGVA